ncbi:MAG: class II aldolase/adducin family protein [Lentisphaeria bacterium]|nr:class II aldolase/adducin family protein [Lentisphaeria bacterium]
MMNPPNPSAEADDVLFHGAERRETAYFMRRLYRQFLTTTSGGNVSRRLPDGNIAITASQSDKAEQSPENVGIVTPDGKNLTPELKLSIETGMHLAVYRVRPDVHAIVHAHPAAATFFSATDIPINMKLTAEAYAVAGPVIRIPYALMGSPELAELVAEHMKKCDCGLMDNHGVITLGKTLLAAFDKMELLECAAKQTLMGRSCPVRELTQEQLDELDRFAGRK